jgi:hypothetical protein
MQRCRKLPVGRKITLFSHKNLDAIVADQQQTEKFRLFAIKMLTKLRIAFDIIV